MAANSVTKIILRLNLAKGIIYPPIYITNNMGQLATPPPTSPPAPSHTSAFPTTDMSSRSGSTTTANSATTTATTTTNDSARYCLRERPTTRNPYRIEKINELWGPSSTRRQRRRQSAARAMALAKTESDSPVGTKEERKTERD